MNTYAIGDLQGCFEALQRLLALLRFDLKRDRLWFCGDLVNRGPDSLATLRFVKSLGDNAVCVLGNHDLHLLALAQGGAPGRRDTLETLLAAPDREELLAWLQQRPLMHEQDGWLLCHAGIAPEWTLAEARDAARSVEAVLRSAKASKFLAHMYGDEPRLAREAKDARARLRFAVNALTRMRYCRPDGSLELRHKGTPAATPAPLLPWFAHPERRCREPEIVFGHWSTLGQVHWPEHRVWGLDTGAVWGGRLTALHLQTHQLSQVECPECRRPGGADAD